jgi:hypothetical protein
MSGGGLTPVRDILLLYRLPKTLAEVGVGTESTFDFRQAVSGG